MFDSLDEKIKQDAVVGTSRRERVVKITMTVVLSILLFGALYMAVQFLE